MIIFALLTALRSPGQGIGEGSAAGERAVANIMGKRCLRLILDSSKLRNFWILPSRMK